MNKNQIKNDVLEILQSKTQVVRRKKGIPKEEEAFTFKNGMQSYVGAVFVDIIDSTALFTKEKPEVVARIMRAFTQEIIKVLNRNYTYRQIGIRGDCVYSINNILDEEDIENLFSATYEINSFHIFFKSILKENNFPTFEIGIGMAVSNTLVIKAGQKGVGINDNIWIGESVSFAAKLSDEAGRNGKDRILLNFMAWNNLSDHSKSFFRKTWSEKIKEYVYEGDVVVKGF
ncbi:adenylate/guanylate cyclase domain-containing protein [[Acholeplasma] multilocale]|uniref:adenylate/guanylate cyclase domain-containing protein n=1 Tax=[Acholeplasma] multilocale TaxID=264638 RepID=UPI000687B921|nr:adenylate/guanylate cyclase domain-containing protein [[Acholeplasma] multilocale]